MADSTQFTTAQYLTLKAAIATGTKSVQYSDKQVTYRSLEEMLELLRLMETELGIGANSTTGQGRRRVGSFTKGL
jgi:hypothetical protein